MVLMMLSKSILMGSGPVSTILVPDPMRHLPTSVTSSDPRGINAGAVGAPKNALVSAMGEYLERLCFYVYIQSEGTVTESELERPCLDALKTLTSRPLPDNFKAIECIRLNDSNPVWAPVNLVSLGVRYEQEPLPNRDTSGCAIHSDPTTSILTALKEFIERQCLMRFWLEDMPRGILEKMPPHPVYDSLSQQGKILVYDISDEAFPVHCFFAVFLGTGQPVWFSSGLCVDTNPLHAYDKALLELWQIYLYVYGVDVGQIDRKDISDSYQRDFLQYNRQQTHSLFNHSAPDLPFPRKAYKADVNCLIDALLAVGDNLYLYTRTIGCRAKPLTISRIFSPDFFLHIKLTGNMNWGNSYSKKFNRILTSRMVQDLPFP